ncbi:hypothetical protein N7457_000800 [Penicillium paradoxum]|uniref:uncharacterized protein n=1 Tax=Penicillium paradoxum TaxID=176176 RepID=UPI0025471DE3|nr:uncharacterized protein N7457_000800 [Penicillium paradoxum]KAJ5794201.1 hypothetical protein N7457_000800 [Penicillium paradoxum]
MHRVQGDVRSTLDRSAPTSVSNFQEERSHLLNFLEQQARLIRQQPELDTIDKVKVNLTDHATELLRRVHEAAVAMAIIARNHPYVTAKPPGFYNIDVPTMCEALEKRMPDLARRLGLNPRCDMCVHFTIENILADLGF